MAMTREEQLATEQKGLRQQAASHRPLLERFLPRRNSPSPSNPATSTVDESRDLASTPAPPHEPILERAWSWLGSLGPSPGNISGLDASSEGNLSPSSSPGSLSELAAPARSISPPAATSAAAAATKYWALKEPGSNGTNAAPIVASSLLPTDEGLAGKQAIQDIKQAGDLYRELYPQASTFAGNDISNQYTGLSRAGTKIYQTTGENGEPTFVGFAPVTPQEKALDQQRSELTAARTILRANPQDYNAALRAQNAELDLAYAENPAAFAARYAKPSSRSAGDAGDASIAATKQLAAATTHVDHIAKTAIDPYKAELARSTGNEEADAANLEKATDLDEAVRTVARNTSSPEAAGAAAKALFTYHKKVVPWLIDQAKTPIIGRFQSDPVLPQRSGVENIKELYMALATAASAGEDETVSINGVSVDAQKLREQAWAHPLYEQMGYTQKRDKRGARIYERNKQKDWLGRAARAAPSTAE